MKLWGWWRKDSPTPTKDEPIFLDDLPPKFEDNVKDASKAQKVVRPSLSKILKSISVDDFKLMPQVPCFRNAMLAGLGMGGVAGTVIFVSRRSIQRTVNWMFLGFVVGSVISWEQCRFRLYRGKRNVRQAQEIWKRKEEEEGHKPSKNR